MKKLLFILLSLCLVTSCTQKQIKEKDSPIKIMIATDLHYLADNLHNGGKLCESLYQLNDGKIVQYGKEIILTLVDTVLEIKPDVLLLTGDLTFNGEKDSHEELASLLQPIVDSGIQVLTMPGNHDINNYFAYSYTNDEVTKVDTISDKDFQSIYKGMGYDNAEMKDKNSLSYCFKVSEDLWIMSIDTNRYEYNTALGLYNNGKVREETFEWMEKCLKKTQKENAKVLFTTHYTLLDNPYLYTTEYRVRNNEEVYQLMEEYGVVVNFSGHTHIQSILSNTYNDQTFYDISTEALCVAENLYGLVTIENDVLTYESYALDVENWAKENNVQDENLLNFKEYSWNQYVQVSYDLFLDNYKDLDIDDSVKEDIATFFSKSNPNLFSGKLDEIKNDANTYDIENIMNEYGTPFHIKYMNLMIDDRELDQRKIEIKLK